MRINLRTFEIVLLGILALGLFCALSMIPELRIFGFIMLTSGGYLIYEIGEERKRRRRKAVFYRRMSKIIESAMAS